MVRIEVLLRRLEEEQAQLAKETLQQPQGRDAFDYGRAVGLYAGIEHVKTIVINMVAERDRKDFDL
jgi:hypothetical protein